MNRLLETPPSFWYFLSGVVAAAGVNLLTGLAVSTFNLIVFLLVFLSASAWLSVAWILAGIAKLLESALQEASLVITDQLSRSERTEVRNQLLNEVRSGFGKRMYAAFGLIFLAILISVGASLASSARTGQISSTPTQNLLPCKLPPPTTAPSTAAPR